MPRPAASSSPAPARGWRRRLATALAAALAVAGLAGCGLAEREDAAAEVAEGFHAALAEGDTAAACELLAPATQHEVEESADAPCAEALEEEDLPEASTAEETAVFGRMAQVALDGDTVFLARGEGTWLVDAAGCVERPDLPYDCTVSGG